MDVVLKTEMPEIGAPRRGKVRDIYDMGDRLLLVASDRISAFDVILPNGIPGKGKVLSGISLFWFGMMKDIVSNHIISSNVDDYPKELHKFRAMLEGRSVLVKKTKVLPVECIVRGYISGSGWKSYKKDGTVCGIKLRDGLRESEKLDEPIFTPSTKADTGHDINISYDEMLKIVGGETGRKLRDLAIAIYKKASAHAEKKGIIIADTKMEFGMMDGQVILIDELLTPDSSRFWSIKGYEVGKGQDSFDKQIVRDYLLTLDWDQTYPGPVLPDEIVAKTIERYKEIFRILST